MTLNVVARPTTSISSKYDTRNLFNELRKLSSSEALEIDVTGLKFVNFHSCIYKLAKSEGFKLHYSLTNNIAKFWLS